ncbi:MAG: hypothetical protein ABI874_09070, partial [Chloroflexota bacterium]
MFLSVILPLTALDSLAPPAFLGREAHALFLDWVRHASPALAAQLHADEQRKPFTVSGLRRAPNPQQPNPQPLPSKGRGVFVSPLLHGEAVRPAIDGRAGVRLGETYQLRITSLTAELSRALTEAILPQLPQTARLGDAHFQVGAPLLDGAAHEWAGRTTADALFAKWFDAGARASSRVELQFVSPTAVKQRGRLLVTPSPESLFHGWLMAWNAYGAPAFENDLIA